MIQTQYHGRRGASVPEFLAGVSLAGVVIITVGLYADAHTAINYPREIKSGLAEVCVSNPDSNRIVTGLGSITLPYDRTVPPKGDYVIVNYVVLNDGSHWVLDAQSDFEPPAGQLLNVAGCSGSSSDPSLRYGNPTPESSNPIPPPTVNIPPTSDGSFITPPVQPPPPPTPEQSI